MVENTIGIQSEGAARSATNSIGAPATATAAARAPLINVLAMRADGVTDTAIGSNSGATRQPMTKASVSSRPFFHHPIATKPAIP